MRVATLPRDCNGVGHACGVRGLPMCRSRTCFHSGLCPCGSAGGKCESSAVDEVLGIGKAKLGLGFGGVGGRSGGRALLVSPDSCGVAWG